MQKPVLAILPALAFFASTLAVAGPLGQASPGASSAGEPAARPLMLARRSRHEKVVTIDGVRYKDHGTEDVRGKSKVEIEADNFYFKPTFLRGKPGQKLTVVVNNESSTLHDFYVAALGIDKQLPAKTKIKVQVTFPDSGLLTFMCKYHSALGMNGAFRSK